MHKNQAKNFARPKGRKTQKRTRKSLKKAKPGAFWVLERMGTGEDGCKRMRKPTVRTSVNTSTIQHMQKENRQKRSVSAGFWQGQKDLNPRHAVLETAALPTELYPYVKFCLIILSFSKVVVNGFFKIFLRVSKNRGEYCFSSYLAVSAKNTVLFGEAQPSVKE